MYEGKKNIYDVLSNTIILTHGNYWYSTKGDSAYVLSLITNYKIFEDPKTSKPTVGFPVEALDKVLYLLRQNKINYYLKYEDVLVDYKDKNNYLRFLHHDLPFSYVTNKGVFKSKPKGSFKVKYEGEDEEEYVIGDTISEDAKLTLKVIESNVGDVININNYIIKIIDKNISYK